MVGFMIISLFVLLTVSLFEFVDRTEWDELSNSTEARLIKNKNYGAYRLRSQQYLLTSMILLGVIVSVLGYMGIKEVALFGGNTADNLKHEASMDSTKFAFDTQIEVETPPSNFNHNGNDGDNMPVAQKGGENVSDKAKDNRETQERPKDSHQNKGESLEDFKKRMEDGYRGTSGQEERDKIAKETEKWRKEYEAKKSKNQQVNGGRGGNSGVDAGPKGDTDVKWDLDGRDAHQHNSGNVKVPGYTCGEGINATIVVKIKVNSNGDVISAELKSNSGGNQCCINQALNYARNKSRFEYSPKEVQEGTITYKFIYK